MENGKIETEKTELPSERSPRPPESGISSVARLIVSVLEDAAYRDAEKKERSIAIIGRILDAEVAFAYERGKSDGMAFVIGAQK